MHLQPTANASSSASFSHSSVLHSCVRWRWRFSGAYATWALLIFLAEAAIATVGRDVEWLRWYVGDILVVAWVHCLIGAVLQAPMWRVAAASLGIACAVELSQYVCGVMGWVIHQPLLRIIVGSTAEWMDVAAYAVGALIVPVALQMSRVLQARPTRQR